MWTNLQDITRHLVNSQHQNPKNLKQRNLQCVRWESMGNYNDRLRESPPPGKCKHNVLVVFDC